MATQINPIINKEVLDHALVECLRLFAQHGRKVSSQKLITSEKLSNGDELKIESMNPNNKDTRQK